jgi:hypothetical protein
MLIIVKKHFMLSVVMLKIIMLSVVVPVLYKQDSAYSDIQRAL